MRGDFFSFTPTAKLVLLTNPKPIITGTDYAIWRRIHMMAWERTVAPGEVDEQLRERLVAEGAGILNWSIAGCRAWRERGLRPTQAMLRATAEYRREMDVLGDWLEERCQVAPHLSEASMVLYASYRAFILDRGEKPVGHRTWSNRMHTRGFTPARTATDRRWRGLALRAQT